MRPAEAALVLRTSATRSELGTCESNQVSTQGRLIMPYRDHLGGLDEGFRPFEGPLKAFLRPYQVHLGGLDRAFRSFEGSLKWS